MNAVVLAVFGGGLGLGLLLLVAGGRGIAVFDLTSIREGRLARYVDRLILRVALATSAVLVALSVSHWVVLAAVAGGVGWSVPSWGRLRGGHPRELALVEAIATWTEQLRDTLAAANGLEHALGATAPLAPPPIAGPVERLAARTDYERLSAALRRFADEVDHPMADFVVAALIIAAEREARDVGGLLGHLADSARDEARMRTRIWVGRARTRSAVRIIVVVIVGFVLALLVFNRDYLAPYDSAGGQLVLTGIIALFVSSVVAMRRMGAIALPPRFVARRPVEDAQSPTAAPSR